MELNHVLRAVAEALLIGFLVGAEREASREETERHPGVRDFIIVAQVGVICGLLGKPYLTVAALVSIAGLLAVFHFETRERSGVTTEMAAIATFCLGYLTATPDFAFGPFLAVALTIIMVFVLEAKRGLHKFVREGLTETEFNDTLRFLAIVFIVYPVLPAGAYGPRGAIIPRQIWLFVILVSSISYLGYFLEKFLGSRVGLRFAGVLGGLASSTAATASFARQARENEKDFGLYRQAIVLANAMQFPRVVAVLYVANPDLAGRMLGPLFAMTATGLALGWFVGRPAPDTGAPEIRLRNPFRLLPALKFGALFAALVFLSRTAVAALGPSAFLWTAALGGSADADAAVLAASDLLRAGTVGVTTAGYGLLAGLLANAVTKTGIAAYAGNLRMALLTAAAFAAMFAAGAAGWLLIAWR